MKKKLIVFTIIFLFLINISALITILYKSGSIEEPAAVDEQSVASKLKQEFDLSETQAAEIGEIRSSFENELGNVGIEINEKQMELFNAIRSENPDTKSINELIDRISLLQAKLQKEAVKHIITEKGLLNPVQQERYFKRFFNRFGRGQAIGGRGRGRMGGRGGMGGRDYMGDRKQKLQKEDNF